MSVGQMAFDQKTRSHFKLGKFYEFKISASELNINMECPSEKVSSCLNINLNSFLTTFSEAIFLVLCDPSMN
jgi:hypothetical protein